MCVHTHVRMYAERNGIMCNVDMQSRKGFKEAEIVGESTILIFNVRHIWKEI